MFLRMVGEYGRRTYQSVHKKCDLIFKPLSDDKIFALSYLKEFADEKLDTKPNIKFMSNRAEKIVGKGKKC